MSDDNTKNDEELTEEDLALAGKARLGSSTGDDDEDTDEEDTDPIDDEDTKASQSGDEGEGTIENTGKETLVTKEGLAALKDELLQLETVKRKD